ncbi:hypothetical protein ACOMHN_058286 [Nucella lapillus]
MWTHNATWGLSSNEGQTTWVGGVMGTLGVMTVVLNLLLLVALLVHAPSRSRSFHLHITNMAAAAILQGAGVLPLWAHYLIQGTWVHGDAVCRWWLAADTMATSVSALAIVVTACDRFIYLICWRFVKEGGKYVSSFMLMFVSWLLALTLTLTLTLMQFESGAGFAGVQAEGQCNWGVEKGSRMAAARLVMYVIGGFTSYLPPGAHSSAPGYLPPGAHSSTPGYLPPGAHSSAPGYLPPGAHSSAPGYLPPGAHSSAPGYLPPGAHSSAPGYLPPGTHSSAPGYLPPGTHSLPLDTSHRVPTPLPLDTSHRVPTPLPLDTSHRVPTPLPLDPIRGLRSAGSLGLLSSFCHYFSNRTGAGLGTGLCLALVTLPCLGRGDLLPIDEDEAEMAVRKMSLLTEEKKRRTSKFLEAGAHRSIEVVAEEDEEEDGNFPQFLFVKKTDRLEERERWKWQVSSLLAVTVAWTLLWLPSHLFVFADKLGLAWHIPQVAVMACVILGYAHAAIMPLLWLLYQPVRAAMAALIFCRCCQDEEDEDDDYSIEFQDVGPYRQGEVTASGTKTTTAT